jgi:site-specific DNA-adenine methylase
MKIKLFPSPGSKSQLATQLVGMYPRHTRYVEPFAGGASCFWVKPPGGQEVLNDFDPDVAGAYKTVRDLSSEEVQDFISLDWKISPETFALAQLPSLDPVEAAYRFIYRRRASFMHRENRIARQKIGSVIPMYRYMVALWERLQGVEVRQGNGLNLLTEMDAPGTFFFIDPPWPGYFPKWKHYTMDNIFELMNAVENIVHAKWLWAETPTMYNYLPREVIDKWRVGEITMNSTGMNGRKSLKRELLMSNVPL